MSCGVLKNIIAIAVGMGDVWAPATIRAAPVENGRNEPLAEALGGKPGTFAGLAGMGDMIATHQPPEPQSACRHGIGERPVYRGHYRQHAHGGRGREERPYRR